MTKLHTPQSIVETPALRYILQWYLRFDLFAGLLSGYGAIIGREWFEAIEIYLKRQVDDEPDNLTFVYERTFSESRSIAIDMALLLHRKSKGDMSDQEFSYEISKVNNKFTRWEESLPSAITNPAYRLESFLPPKFRVPHEDDPFEPEFLFEGELWATNYAYLDFWALQLMWKSQIPALEGGSPCQQQILSLVDKINRLVEAIDRYQHRPAGSIPALEASIAISSLFALKDERTALWCCQKLAAVEQNGFVCPLSESPNQLLTALVDTYCLRLCAKESKRDCHRTC